MNLIRLTDKFRGTGMGRITPFKQVYRYIYRGILPKDTIKCINTKEGFQIHVDLEDMGDVTHSLLSRGVYDPQMTSVLKETVKPMMYCVDVGANIGYFSILMSKLVGPHGRVGAFEPAPKNFDLLKKSIFLNGCERNTALYWEAVSSKTGKSTLSINKEFQGSHYLIPEGMGIPVDTVKLDDYFCDLDYGSIDLVKIDVQGAEVEVLKGMKELRTKYPNMTIIVEYLPEGLVRAGSTLEEFFQTIIDNHDINDVELSNIDEASHLTYLTTPEEIMRKYPAGKFTNLLVKKRGTI